LCSGSHVVILLVKKYPHYKIVNLDKLDYCSSLKNLEAVAGYPNYTFVKVRTGALAGLRVVLRACVRALMAAATIAPIGSPRSCRAPSRRRTS